MITYRWIRSKPVPGVVLPNPSTFDSLLAANSTHRYTVDIRVADTTAITALNLQYRSTAAATDILSFPLYASIAELPNTDAPLGDLVICPAMMDTDHLNGSQIVTHGVFHLLGFDHEADPDGWNTAHQQINIPNDQTAS